jgi:hypothetical protein
VEAVFEAAPYLPGVDGRFHPHEESIGFAKTEASALDAIADRALSTRMGSPGRGGSPAGGRSTCSWA